MSPPVRRRWWYAVLVAVLVGAGGLLLPQGAWRLGVLAVVMLWAPGAAALGALPGLDPTTRIALVPGTSAAIVLLGSSVMVEAHFWHPTGFVAAVATAACLTALSALARPEGRTTPRGAR